MPNQWAGFIGVARLRKVARFLRTVWGVVASVGFAALMCAAVYRGGWVAVGMQLVAWCVMVLVTTDIDRHSAQVRRLGWHDGYKRGWRDNVEKKEYEPWPT